MKKYTLLFIIGGFLVAVGLLLFVARKKETVYYGESEVSVEEATEIILEKTREIVDVYENKTSVFKVVKSKSKNIEEAKEETTDTAEKPVLVVDENEYIKVSNYDEVINNLFTTKGKEELEQIKFNGKLFVQKDDSTIYLLTNIPLDNSFLNTSISIDKVSVNMDEIDGIVYFTSDELDSNDMLNYYVYEKKIKLIKNDDKWLVDTFVYQNK